MVLFCSFTMVCFDKVELRCSLGFQLAFEGVLFREKRESQCVFLALLRRHSAVTALWHLEHSVLIFESACSPPSEWGLM